MKNYKGVIFDLDGTLTDSKEGIIDSLDYSLKHFKVKVERESLGRYIGEPLFKIYREVLKTDDREKIDLAIRLYRENFEVEGMFKNRVYDGVERLLYELKLSGKDIFLATIKPTKFATKILTHFSLIKYFKGVLGTEMDGKNSSKEELIGLIIEKYKMDKNEVVMVGDRKSDYDGAKYNGIDSIIVGYGYIDENEKKLIEPTFFVDGILELKKILIGGKDG
ncbi:MAG: HAD hydrolase-like protein [bacterium]|uniref:5'-nucleotidase n=2 Tax=Bacteria candidate phyla TaxID=1783234 RepID=A0A101I024_UNCT6|nr:MAG: 5'-nucleotidase [candidate division TA06 bacterium 32_111]KUK86253.1 MAG: 5'-nucleotidase [candidate division TA06 bacterium 34_109]MDI6699953.1 HAD hydrolase-like protein [bacterium]HAF08333.1 phosphoglycolate phosphatase [candidate division WOR-3 bacterium]HCP17029.1 phosphoglycolate phosphatase [candidate division WOR-3 bacterium]